MLSFPRLSPSQGQIIRVLLSRLPSPEDSRLTCLNRIPIAVASGRINRSCEVRAHNIGVVAGFHLIIECRIGEVPTSGFLQSPCCWQRWKWVDHTSQPGRNVASYLSYAGDHIYVASPERWCSTLSGSRLLVVCGFHFAVESRGVAKKN